MSHIKEDNSYVIHGPEPAVPLGLQTVGNEILKTLQSLPQGRLAMIDAFTGEKLLSSQLLQNAINLATALKFHGYYGQSTVLSISSSNSLDFFVPILASFFNGTIMAPLNHTYTPYELNHVIRIGCAKVIFCSEEVLPKYVELKKSVGFIERIVSLSSNVSEEFREDVETLKEFVSRALKGANARMETFEVYQGKSDKTAALILCSSGTTGLPKGVALSHLNLSVRISHSRDPQYVPSTYQNVLGLMPFFHAFGLLTTFSALLNGQTVICLKHFDEDVFLRSIQDYKIKNLTLAPPLAVFLAKSPKVLRYDLSSITDVYCGAAPLSANTEEEVKQRLKCDAVRQAYGLTETTLSVTLVGRNEAKRGSCGKVMSFISCKVRDPETGRSLGPNQVGELCWKGPSMMMGYYKNEKATKEIFTPDGWLKSGDLGYYDEERYFYIIDRLKELIKYKGYQVAPAELEAIILNHPAVIDVGVVGLPDERVGERPLAFVVKKEDADITAEQLKKYVADMVSPQKRLSGGVVFVDSIPKNPSGKILRRQLREYLKKYITKAKL
ncbi:luciferin 4-monooxygenase-like [Anthonomus grandis grandis]|uniref:luciferin 4-monooxygenase-like n=1 Tax=Anthonomus grandis grandis TaxID=2921223 RepID=UPI0021658839|nr:luciferin 4-monooxygenase-like [Anthonomus grandis grandis]